MTKKYSGKMNILLRGLFLLLIFLYPSISLADTESELNFYVTPKFPESQLAGGASGYFDLNIDAGKSDTLGIEIKNNSEKPLILSVTAHTAYTNVNGVVEYGKDAAEKDPTLPYIIDELIGAPGEITLDGHEKKIVNIPITMPEQSFEGVLAGGIRIQEVQEHLERSEKTEGLAIQNAFAYVVGVIVSNNRSAIETGLDLLGVSADQVNYRNVFGATLQNYTSTFINQLEVEAKVFKEDGDEILYQTEQEGMQMAPNSHFSFPIPLNGDRLRSGNYRLEMVARSQGEEWTWTEMFSIEAEQARQLNQHDVTIQQSMNWWMISTITIVIIFLIFIAYMLYRKKMNKLKTH